MKCTITTTHKPSPKAFPGLYADGCVTVLATDKHTGTVVSSTSTDFPIGYFSTSWPNFLGLGWTYVDPYTEVVLHNDRPVAP